MWSVPSVRCKLKQEALLSVGKKLNVKHDMMIWMFSTVVVLL